MAKVYALYKTPTDPAAFDRYYFDRHVPLDVRPRQPPRDVVSPQGQAVAGDLGKFATGGVDVLITETGMV